MRKIWVLGWVSVLVLFIAYGWIMLVQPIHVHKKKKDEIPKGLKIRIQKYYSYSKEKSGEYSKNLLTKDIAVYNNDGYLIEYTVYNKEKLNYRDVYKPENKGKDTEMISYNSDGKVDYIRKFEYDKNGYPVSEITYNADWSVRDKRNYINNYDKDGRIINSTKYDSNGNMIEKFNWTYHKNGGQTEWYKYGSDGALIQKMVFIDDSEERVIELTYERNNKSGKQEYSDKTVYQYGDDGYRETSSLNRAGIKDSICLKVLIKSDVRGNLIEENRYRIELKSGKEVEIPDSQTTYEYEFYPELKK